MGFSNKKNKYIASLSCLTSYQRKATTSAVILFILLFWLFFMYTVTQRKITYRKKLLHQTLKKKQLLEKYKNKCKNIKKKIKHLKSDIQNHTNNKNLKTNSTQIISDAKSSGITLKSYTTLEETQNQNKVLYEFAGNTNQALLFCEKLKKSKQTLECQEASLSIGEKIGNQNRCCLKCILQFLDTSAG